MVFIAVSQLHIQVYCLVIIDHQGDNTSWLPLLVGDTHNTCMFMLYTIGSDIVTDSGMDQYHLYQKWHVHSGYSVPTKPFRDNCKIIKHVYKYY